MKKLIHPFLLYAAVLLCSCETVTELDLPDHTPRLVVNSVFNPDSLFTVDLSASQSVFTDRAYAPVQHATVQVYQAGKLLFDLPNRANGLYQAAVKPAALQHYELRVSAPGYPSVQATSHVPAAPALRDVKVTRTPASGDRLAGVRMTFVLQDAPGQDNFYFTQAYTPDYSPLDGSAYKRTVGLQFASPIEHEFSMERRWFFSDKLFNGQAMQLELLLENNPDEVCFVQVAHITKAYYDYVRTLEKQSYRDNFGVTPIPVANNIQKGMGLFAGYNAVTLKVRP